jgi:hypothetical protein
MQHHTAVFGSQAGRVIASSILLAAPLLKSQSLPPTPKSPKQIALWVVEDVWNKGDLRLINQMFTPGALFHYRGRDFPLTPEFGLQTVQS